MEFEPKYKHLIQLIAFEDAVYNTSAMLFRLYVTWADSRLAPDNERRRYKVTPSLIGWTQT